MIVRYIPNPLANKLPSSFRPLRRRRAPPSPPE